MRLTVIITLLVSSSLTGISQSEEEIKKALELTFVCVNADGARSGSILIPGEYQYDETKKIIGQKYLTESFPDRYLVTNEGMMELQFFNGQLQTAIKKVGCTGLAHVEVDYVTTYNDQKQISRIERRTWYSNGKGGLNKPAWQIEYKQNRIVKVSQYKLISEGKNVLSAAPLFDFLEYQSTIDWQDDGTIAFTVNEYTSKKKAKDTQKIISTVNYESQISKGKTSIKRGTITSTFEVGPNLVSRTYIDPVYAKKEVIVMNLNPDGLVEKVTASEFKVEALQRKVVSSIEYIADPAVQDNCQYKTKEKTQVFNAQGELIEERENNQVRVKNPDGTWGPWQNFRY
jgi:hypothetical protein